MLKASVLVFLLATLVRGGGEYPPVDILPDAGDPWACLDANPVPGAACRMLLARAPVELIYKDIGKEVIVPPGTQIGFEDGTAPHFDDALLIPNIVVRNYTAPIEKRDAKTECRNVVPLSNPTNADLRKGCDPSRSYPRRFPIGAHSCKQLGGNAYYCCTASTSDVCKDTAASSSKGGKGGKGGKTGKTGKKGKNKRDLEPRRRGRGRGGRQSRPARPKGRPARPKRPSKGKGAKGKGKTRGGKTRGGKTRGGKTRGGKTRGGKTRGGKTRGGKTRGGKTRGGKGGRMCLRRRGIAGTNLTDNSSLVCTCTSITGKFNMKPHGGECFT